VQMPAASFFPPVSPSPPRKQPAGVSPGRAKITWIYQFGSGLVGTLTNTGNVPLDRLIVRGVHRDTAQSSGFVVARETPTSAPVGRLILPGQQARVTITGLQ